MVKLTKHVVEASMASGKDCYVWDDMVPGLGVRIYRSGKRSYLIQYRIGKRTRRCTLGPHGIWTVESARKEAKVFLARVARGIDPIAERRRASTTIRDLCDLYLSCGLATAKESSIAQARSNIANHINPLVGHIAVDEITRYDIRKMMQDVAQGKTAKAINSGRRGISRNSGGKGAANRTVTTLCAALSFAVDQDLRNDNPAYKIKRFPSKKFDRFLSPTELSRLGAVLATAEALGVESPYALAAIKLLIMTGCRKSEILSLKWKYIDLHHHCLRLPDSKTGGKVVHLGMTVVRFINHIKPVEGNPYLLPGKRPGRPLTDLASVWRRLRTSAVLEDVRIHDLRHSFASMGACNGDSLVVIGTLLGHRTTRTTERYVHLADDPVRSAANRIATLVSRCLDPAGDPEDQMLQTDTRHAILEKDDIIHEVPAPVLERAVRTKWLDTRAAAAFLGNTVGTLQTYRWMGIGPDYSKVGRRIVYDLETLKQWRGLEHRCQSKDYISV